MRNTTGPSKIQIISLMLTQGDLSRIEFLFTWDACWRWPRRSGRSSSAACSATPSLSGPRPGTNGDPGRAPAIVLISDLTHLQPMWSHNTKSGQGTQRTAAGFKGFRFESSIIVIQPWFCMASPFFTDVWHLPHAGKAFLHRGSASGSEKFTKFNTRWTF